MHAALTHAARAQQMHDSQLTSAHRLLDPDRMHVCVLAEANRQTSPGLQDRSAVVERAKKAGVVAFIITGSCLATSRKAAALSEGIADVPSFFTAGVHPHNAKARCSCKLHHEQHCLVLLQARAILSNLQECSMHECKRNCLQLHG